MRRVAIFSRVVPNYRVAFFEGLARRLREENVELKVIHGMSPEGSSAPSVGQGVLSEKVEVWTNCRYLFKKYLWQSAPAEAERADLIILSQVSSILSNYRFLLKRRLSSKQKVAFWGHGRNFQSRTATGLADRFKASLAGGVDWWFAYNDLSARAVEETGFAADRITSVQNTVDSVALVEARVATPWEEIERLRSELGLVPGHVAVFTGGLHAEKRLQFLLDAARIIRRKVPDFRLLIIGDGPERDLVAGAASGEEWISYLGRMGMVQKVKYWMASDLLLMPGLVGLVIIDSFALETPMVTTDYPYHSPEVSYLVDGENGLLVQCGDSVERYADAVVELLEDKERLGGLREGARKACARFSMENMVDRFAEGVLRAIDAPPNPRV